MDGLRIFGVLAFSCLLGCAARPPQVPRGDAFANDAEPEAHNAALLRTSSPQVRAQAARRAARHVVVEESLPSDTVVLHVGSSSAGALGPELNRLLESQGVTGILKFKQSTYVPQWAGAKMGLARYVAKYDPDLVIVSLGGNETEIPDPTVRVAAIRRLVKTIGDRPCVWIGTPRWKVLRHTGILEVVRANAAPCRFIDTDELAPDMEPLKDGIHPTVPERRRWARRVMEWLILNRDPQGAQPWSLKLTSEMPPEER
jgi:hypothetical protein